MGNSDIRVLVVDLDGGAAQGALSEASDMHLLTASSFEHATELLPTSRAQAVVVALGAPRASDMSSLKDSVAAAQGIPVMAFSRPVPGEPATQVLKSGVSGYLFTQDARFLSTSVRELLRGGLPLSPAVSQLVLQRARRSSSKMAAVQPESAAARGLLSQRQQQILALLQYGHSYEDIGTALDLSVNTIRSHLRAIYERLGAASKVEAVMIGMELGLLKRARSS